MGPSRPPASSARVLVRPRFRLGRAAVCILLLLVALLPWFLIIRPRFEQLRFEALVDRLGERGITVKVSENEPPWVGQYLRWAPQWVRSRFVRREAEVQVGGPGNLAVAPLGRGDWETLAGLPGLTQLTVEAGGEGFDDSCLELFRSCPGLYALELRKCRVSAAAWRRLPEWPALRSVILKDPKLTDAEIRELTGIPWPIVIIMVREKIR